MARYMGGPRGCREPSPLSRAPSSPKDKEVVVSSNDGDNTHNSDDEDNSDPLTNVKVRESIEFDNDDNGQYIGDVSSEDHSNVSEVEESENEEMDVDGNTPTRRRPGQHEQMRRNQNQVLLFPRLPISSHKINNVEDEDSSSISIEYKQGNRLQRHQRKLTPGIDIDYTNPNSSGSFFYVAPPLSISYGWMVKGTKEHIEDIYISGSLFSDKEVRSKRKIEVLCEYTWIQTTPSQEKRGDIFPAIYVPGNTRNWQGLRLRSSLNQEDLYTAVSRTVRDEHAFLQPHYRYEPTFRALELANPDFSFKDIDIVTDSETLAHLLAFICGPRATRTPVTKPFRVDLCTVRNTLFIIPKEKSGRGNYGPLPKHERSDPMSTVPEWAAHVLGRMGSKSPKLPYSGGHYRLVRYRFGNVVLAVRVKVDFVYEHRKTPTRSICDPLYGVTTEAMSAPTPYTPDDGPIWRTAVKSQGLGTKPAAAGIATVRYACKSRNAALNEMLPQMWFSRTPFLVEAVVSYPTLEINDASLINSRSFYKAFENAHRCSLRYLAGLLKHLRVRTRELGGNAVVICDPVQVCFVLLKPVMETKPVPDDIAFKFWGPDDNLAPASERESARTPESVSDLTDFSKTPTPPDGSDLLDTWKSGKRKSSKNNEAKKVARDGSPARIDRQRAQGIDPMKMVEDWNLNVRQSVEDEGYEPDVEDNTNGPATGSHDGYMSFSDNDVDSDDDIMMGESAYEDPHRLSDASDEMSSEDDEGQHNCECLMAGTYNQQEIISEESDSGLRDDSDDGSSPTATYHQHLHQSHPEYSTSSPENGRPVAQPYTDDDENEVRSPAKTPEYHLVTSSQEDQSSSAHSRNDPEVDPMEVDDDTNNDGNQNGALNTVGQSGPTIQSGPFDHMQPSPMKHSSYSGQPSGDVVLGAKANAALRDEERRRLLGL
ncbi:hypothetical protein VM1G_06283 [Cytospora mali]|uniref:Uncharacterized protein n=1 Tax=Cytospora mali TaxID=578113 RepID=A0A194W1Z6_CYTMA|nr:hypothetical protein VM1G_06283 [Valsa mali]